MESTKKRFREKLPITIIILLFILASAFLALKSTGLLWDSAVYVGIGKSIFSFGNSGFWEASRPLLWPLILGFVWKMGLNTIAAGKIMGIIFGAGCILLTYIIGRKIFSDKIALLASILLSFTPVFLISGSQLLTGIPSTFFALAAFYFFIEKRWIHAGLFAGLACMTRFLQLFGFIFLALFLLWSGGENIIRRWSLMAAGFSIPVIPYLAINLVLYNNPLYPFLLQSYMTKYTGWLWWEPLSFYFINLFMQNFLMIFSLMGIYLLFRKRNREGIALFGFFMALFLFYNLNIHKEVRFAITFLPSLCLLASYGLFYLIDMPKKKKIGFILLAVLMGIWVIQIQPQIKSYHFDENYAPYSAYTKTISDSGEIWVTSPLFLVESGKRASLIYYPAFGTEMATGLQSRMQKAGHILFNSCDILCPPWDKTCPEEKEKLIGMMQGKFKEEYSDVSGGCRKYIFSAS